MAHTKNPVSQGLSETPVTTDIFDYDLYDLKWTIKQLGNHFYWIAREPYPPYPLLWRREDEIPFQLEGLKSSKTE